MTAIRGHKRSLEDMQSFTAAEQQRGNGRLIVAKAELPATDGVLSVPAPAANDVNHAPVTPQYSSLTPAGQYIEPPAKVAKLFNDFLQDEDAHAAYMQRRNQLLQNEVRSSWDYPAIAAASEAEKKAARIITEMREKERTDVFGNHPSESIPDPSELDMGGQFLTNRPRIEENSRVFHCMQRMPKGCQLHIHFNAQLHPQVLLAQARAHMQDTMYIRSNRPLLTAEDYRDPLTEIEFHVKPRDTPSVDIFSDAYAVAPGEKWNGHWMKLESFCETFEKKFAMNADEWILDKIIIQPTDVYGELQTLNGVWAKFNQSTRGFKGLHGYESIFRLYISLAIDDMVKDGIMYAEMRPMWMDKFIYTDDGERKLYHEDQLDIIQQELDMKHAHLTHEGKGADFPFGIKMIYCAPRSIPPARMRAELLDCIKLKLKYPELICGFDLVGAEDRRNSISYYSNELLSFQQTCEALDIEIPFMFHAGESLLDEGGSHDPSLSNLYDCVLLNTKRVGHGCAILKHPRLIQKFKDRHIAIELCLVSNELLHLCRNIKQHPFPQMLQAGLPCTLNSDNPALFRSPNKETSCSLSYEFYQFLVGDPRSTIHGCRQLSEWSIMHSCLTPDQQQQMLDTYHAKWETWCRAIVEEHEGA